MNGGVSPGSPSGSYSGDDARPTGAAGPGNEARQLQREVREWTGNAEELRRRLAQAGVNSKDIEAAIGDVQGMYAGDSLDPKGLDQLKASIDRLKKFEFDLRKKVNGEDQQLFLSGSDEVPAQFRAAIEEYYRALAKKGTK